MNGERLRRSTRSGEIFIKGNFIQSKTDVFLKFTYLILKIFPSTYLFKRKILHMIDSLPLFYY